MNCGRFLFIKRILSCFDDFSIRKGSGLYKQPAVGQGTQEDTIGYLCFQYQAKTFNLGLKVIRAKDMGTSVLKKQYCQYYK